MSENTSGISPRGHRVLIKPFEVEEKTASGIVVSTGRELQREQMAQTEGIIVEIGNTAWHDQPAPWAQVGDHVIFAKYSGTVSTGEDKVEYRIVNDLDIVAVKRGKE